MRITQSQFDRASNAAFGAAEASPDEVVLSDRALLAFAEALGIEVVQVVEAIWVRATIADVIKGDVIRPEGSDVSAAGTVTFVGPVLTWHVDDVRGGTNAQYRPGDHLLTRTCRKITIEPLAGGSPITPADGMLADFPIEIRTDAAGWRAIEACGGWSARVAIKNHDS